MPLYGKAGGVIVPVQPFVNKAGVWTRVKAGYGLKAGAWQNAHDLIVTDFREYPAGVQPADWTQRWSTVGYTALVQSVPASISGKALRYSDTSPAARRG